MKKTKTKHKQAPKKPRITRSISFEADVYDHVERLAKAKNRSFNWIVNESAGRRL